MRRWLCPGGTLIYTVEHPIFTAQGPQDWCYGPDGEILHFPVDHYFEEGERDAVFLGEHVVKYHRTLTTYLDGLARHGFCLKRVVAAPTHDADCPGGAGMRTGSYSSCGCPRASLAKAGECGKGAEIYGDTGLGLRWAVGAVRGWGRAVPEPGAVVGKVYL